MKSPVRVLVVDDSQFHQQVLGEIITAEGDLEVVGYAGDGEHALWLAKSLRPDIITMDIHMPLVSGLEAIEMIMAVCPTPILVVTGDSDVNLAFEALTRGALDVIMKPTVDPNWQEARALVEKVKLLANVRVLRHVAGLKKMRERAQHPLPARTRAEDHTGIVAIAASTGGPKALAVVLGQLPVDFPLPIVVAQHIVPEFCESFAAWLDRSVDIDVRLAQDGEALRPSVVLIGPADHDVRIGATRIICLERPDARRGYHPSANMLFTSSAQVCRSKTVGVVLTGMSNDGAAGVCKIRGARGSVLVQDESTSAIFGMPKSAIETGCVDKVLPLEEIAAELIRLSTARGSR